MTLTVHQVEVVRSILLAANALIAIYAFGSCRLMPTVGARYGRFTLGCYGTAVAVSMYTHRFLPVTLSTYFTAAASVIGGVWVVVEWRATRKH